MPYSAVNVFLLPMTERVLVWIQQCCAVTFAEHLLHVPHVPVHACMRACVHACMRACTQSIPHRCSFAMLLLARLLHVGYLLLSFCCKKSAHFVGVA